MLRAVLTLCVVLGAGGCSKKSEPNGAADDAAVVKATDAAPAIDAAVKPTLTKEQRADYRAAIREGRKLAKDGKWGEAARSFERALAVIPMDERALSELSFAALKAGDYARARRVATSGVRAGTNPKVIAASYYNMGRAAEALGDKVAAKSHYMVSLRLRPNKEVAKRLESLGGDSQPSLPSPLDEIGCVAKKTRESLCACIAAELAPGSDGKKICSFRPADAGAPGVLLANIGTDFHERLLLVSESDGQLQLQAEIASAYRPGAFGIDEDFELESSTLKKVGDKRVLWIEATHRRRDLDLGIDEEETSETRWLVACALEGTTLKRCARVPTRYRYAREELGQYIGDEPVEHTPGLPIRASFSLRTGLLPSGQLEVVLVDGAAPPFAKPYIGRHPLW